MSSKECGHHHDDGKLLRSIFAGIIAFIVLILLIIFLTWIILRPTKPRFMLQDATVYAFNLSSTTTEPSPFAPTPNTLTITMQVTLSAHNPNDRIGIYYQKLDVYVSYRSQQISLATAVPDTYQGHKDFTVWSPFLYGNSVPVSPYVLSSLQQDQNAGVVMVNVKINGRVKWKVGTWVSGRYHVYVNCPANIGFSGDRNNGIGGVSPVVKFQFWQSCNVDV
ncbi:NDR1/HIN1-like protein 1 [Gastrolobium bilobum]|uniref:NDR1/HIN1-like protein 1 n=1 Tax=Gastrolobium bilobum TaxID=150636 RepID=UPI002AB0AD31|nr:NDR1/HIN1-like protein 1 [Gastrolobium bilobum]